MGGFRGEVEERAATPLSVTSFLNKDFLVKEIYSIYIVGKCPGFPFLNFLYPPLLHVI